MPTAASPASCERQAELPPADTGDAVAALVATSGWYRVQPIVRRPSASGKLVLCHGRGRETAVTVLMAQDCLSPWGRGTTGVSYVTSV